MKTIILSVKPKWAEKILNGEKTIEVRKTAPKETPFKVYLYCTKEKGKRKLLYNPSLPFSNTTISSCIDWGSDIVLNGKVVAEFVCKNVNLYVPMQKMYFIGNSDFFATCLTDEEINNYGKGKDIYGCHITDLKVYDEPKELEEFGVFCKDYAKCENIACYKDTCTQGYIPLKRPPQSWMYVNIFKPN